MSLKKIIILFLTLLPVTGLPLKAKNYTCPQPSEISWQDEGTFWTWRSIITGWSSPPTGKVDKSASPNQPVINFSPDRPAYTAGSIRNNRLMLFCSYTVTNTTAKILVTQTTPSGAYQVCNPTTSPVPIGFDCE